MAVDQIDTKVIRDGTTPTRTLTINSDGSLNATLAGSTASISNVSVTNIPTVSIVDTTIDDYEAVPASTTGTLGGTGALGDFLARLLVVPGSTTGTVGAVSIRDGSTGTAITVYVASVLGSTTTFNIELGIKSTLSSWAVLTGANVSVIACGKFT